MFVTEKVNGDVTEITEKEVTEDQELAKIKEYLDAIKTFITDTENTTCIGVEKVASKKVLTNEHQYAESLINAKIKSLKDVIKNTDIEGVVYYAHDKSADFKTGVVTNNVSISTDLGYLRLNFDMQFEGNYSQADIIDAVKMALVKPVIGTVLTEKQMQIFNDISKNIDITADVVKHSYMFQGKAFEVAEKCVLKVAEYKQKVEEANKSTSSEVVSSSSSATGLISSAVSSEETVESSSSTTVSSSSAVDVSEVTSSSTTSI